jgi:hypothetical protein
LGTVATELEVEFGLRNFLNYEARNSDRDFTGEKRVDTNIAVSSESEYEIFDRDDWGKLSAVLELVWEQRQSNHTYETTYVTNYSNWHAVLGLEWKD